MSNKCEPTLLNNFVILIRYGLIVGVLLMLYQVYTNQEPPTENKQKKENKIELLSYDLNKIPEGTFFVSDEKDGETKFILKSQKLELTQTTPYTVLVEKTSTGETSINPSPVARALYPGLFSEEEAQKELKNRLENEELIKEMKQRRSINH